MELREMTVVVTGAASGIGHALCEGFLGDGARVVAADRSSDGLGDLSARGAFARRIDVSDPEQVEALVDAAVAETGRLDVLINNAGIGFRCELTDHARDQLEEVIRVNLLGPYYGMRYAIPVMRRQCSGRIINLVSRHAESGAAGFSAYGSSKAGLWALTRHAASETADVDILVNGLIPGPTKSGMLPVGQDPRLVYPTARMLATLPPGGPSGRVFWNEEEYVLCDPKNRTAAPS
jgi:NAD(P)-dependent dehydrogenase (short-subunit alcohol dehydrogenase family)